MDNGECYDYPRLQVLVSENLVELLDKISFRLPNGEQSIVTTINNVKKVLFETNWYGFKDFIKSIYKCFDENGINNKLIIELDDYYNIDDDFHFREYYYSLDILPDGN